MSVFDKLVVSGVRAGQIPARTQQARNWFRSTAQQTRGVRPNRIVNDQDRHRENLEPGSMYMYFYDAKTKADLPYWDKFPLIFPVDVDSKGFYGINLHYLPLRLRARLMDSLYQTVNNQRYDETTKLKVSYQILKSSATFKYYKPCFKRYLNNHVRSRFVYIHPSEWDIALFLPTERFQKESKNKVHQESARAFR